MGLVELMLTLAQSGKTQVQFVKYFTLKFKGKANVWANRILPGMSTFPVVPCLAPDSHFLHMGTLGRSR